MSRVLRYPRMSILTCLGAFAAAIARDIFLSKEQLGAANVLLTLTLLLLGAGLCLLSCRFLVGASGVGVGFLFSVRHTAWDDLYALGTLCCNSRRIYLYGLYRTSPDFLHLLNRAPRCGSWGFVVPMSRKLAAAISVYSPYAIDLYTGVRRRKDKGLRPIWQHAFAQLITSSVCVLAAAFAAAVLVHHALMQTTFLLCAPLTLGAVLLCYFALQMLYRAFVSIQTCPCVSKNGVSAGRGLYLSWEEIRFGYVHRLGRFSALYLLSHPLSDMELKGGAPVRCLSMPDTSRLILTYLTCCPHAQKSQF